MSTGVMAIMLDQGPTIEWRLGFNPAGEFRLMYDASDQGVTVSYGHIRRLSQLSSLLSTWLWWSHGWCNDHNNISLSGA